MIQDKKQSIAAKFLHKTFTLPLPNGYQLREVFSFHGRDQLAVAERISKRGLRKGVVLGGIPTVIDIQFNQKKSMADCTIDADGDLTPALKQHAHHMCRNILGLHLNADDFRSFVAKDAMFSTLTESLIGIRVIQSASVFEALTWAIMGQQINVSFAVSLRRTFIQQADRVHSSGLLCYPSPEDVAKIEIGVLTDRQFSKSKAETLLRLASAIADGQLDIVESETNSIQLITKALLDIKGIGPWTVNYGLLRGYAYADCSLHGDVAIRKAIHRLIGGDARPNIQEAEEFLQQFSPHRTMAAAHLWASLSLE